MPRGVTFVPGDTHIDPATLANHDTPLPTARELEERAKTAYPNNLPSLDEQMGALSARTRAYDADEHGMTGGHRNRVHAGRAANQAGGGVKIGGDGMTDPHDRAARRDPRRSTRQVDE